MAIPKNSSYFFDDFAYKWWIDVELRAIPGRVVVDMGELGSVHITKQGPDIPTFPEIIKTEFVKELTKLCKDFHKKYKDAIE